MAREYNISKTARECCSCQEPLAPGQPIVATICESAEEFERKDYCPDCWEAGRAAAGGQGGQDGRAAEPIAVWRTRVPTPKQKKRLFVDDELLVNFFERLDGTEEPARIHFRFVLALVLMRKKLLVYDRSDKDADGTEVWTMHLKGDRQVHKVVNPQMDEDKIAEVSGKLSEILEGEL